MLVSIVILSLGLLGAMGMLMTSVRSTSESGSFTAAVSLARELSEKARINKNVAARNPAVFSSATNPYLVELKGTDADPVAPKGCVGLTGDCGPSDIAAWDIHDWTIRVRETLPEAHVVVCFDDVMVGADDNYAWNCEGEGRTLVVKMGWIPRMGSEKEMQDDRPPRVVMQLVPGHDYDASEAI
ncbi:type IV pilus assembly protein PilV [Variovorax sp. Sphag1AA]|nr:type IV pilus assembly protein PilV [Variovorax sp. Sphag1AA]